MAILGKWWVASGLGLGVLSSFCLGEPTALKPAEVAREFEQRSWRRQDGLPDDRVWAICQTRDGYIWVGTARGLARFDGARFTVFDHVNTPELTNDDCRGVVVDRDGSIWVGTMGGLFRQEGNRFVRCPVDKAAPADFRLGLWPSRSRGVWAGLGPLVLKADPGSSRMFLQADEAHVPAGSEFRVFDEEGDGGQVWVCGSAGIVRLDTKTEQYERMLTNSPFSHQFAVAGWRGPAGERWVLFAEDTQTGGARAKAWLACIQNGVLTRVPVFERPDCLVAGRGSFLVGDEHGALWMPDFENWIHRYQNGKTQRLPVPGLPKGDVVSCVFPDREGNLWLGTGDSGLQCWTRRKVSSYTSVSGLPHDNTWSILEGKDGSVWIGTDGGVSRFKDGSFSNYTQSARAALNDVRALAEDKDGTVWVGTMRSIERIRDGEVYPSNLPGEWVESKVRALHAGRDGAVWIGTVRGLTCVRDSGTVKYTRADGLGSDEVRAILEARSGDVWAGTMGGGLSQLRAGRWLTLSTSNGLSDNNVWALHEDAESVLWIGTENGLNRLENGRVFSFNVDQGLPVGLVNCIVEDDFGRLWIGHNRGVYWVWRKDLNLVAAGRTNSVPAVEYGLSDGLPSLDVNGQKSYPAACKTRDGRLWFPTSAGVPVFDPSLAAFDGVSPIAVVEEVRANGKLVYSNRPQPGTPASLSLSPSPAASALRLPPGSAGVLEFRFTANTFPSSDKASFRYRLAGLSADWIDLETKREAFFTDLRPGDYRFEVVARSHHGVWQPQGQELAFRIEPFLHQAWWFYPVCGLGFAGLVGLAVVWRLGELRRIHRLERENALNEQRRAIARDIHDELGASLTRITHLSNDVQASLTQPEKAEAQARHIERIAGEAVDSIGGLVWANNPEYDTLEDLLAYVREYAATYFAESAVELRLEFPEFVPALPVTGLCRRHLVMIVKEALQNVSKHAGASQVEMRVSVAGNELELEVSDNGQGLAGDLTKSNGNGLSNMRQRVAELGGGIEIHSSPGQGTKIRVRVALSGKNDSRPRAF
jgi:signal transduction histidine kinase/ligand-binding sensor domain-containing protein